MRYLYSFMFAIATISFLGCGGEDKTSTGVDTNRNDPRLAQYRGKKSDDESADEKSDAKPQDEKGDSKKDAKDEDEKKADAEPRGGTTPSGQRRMGSAKLDALFDRTEKNQAKEKEIKSRIVQTDSCSIQTIFPMQ